MHFQGTATELQRVGSVYRRHLEPIASHLEPHISLIILPVFSTSSATYHRAEDPQTVSCVIDGLTWTAPSFWQGRGQTKFDYGVQESLFGFLLQVFAKVGTSSHKHEVSSLRRSRSYRQVPFSTPSKAGPHSRVTLACCPGSRMETSRTLRCGSGRDEPKETDLSQFGLHSKAVRMLRHSSPGPWLQA